MVNNKQALIRNFSKTDLEKIDKLKNLILSDDVQLEVKPNGKVQTHKISNEMILGVRKNFIELKKDLQDKHSKEPASKTKELTLAELKNYYKASYKKMQQQVKLIQALETDKTLNPNEQQAVKALAKAVELTMKRINDKFVQNQVKMEKELERIRQIEEHEEKKKRKEGKSIGRFTIEQVDKALSGLYDILFEPWSKKDKHEAIGKEKDDKYKVSDKEPNQSKISEKLEQKIENKKGAFNVYSTELGNLSPSTSPLDDDFKKQKLTESIPADFYTRRQ